LLIAVNKQAILLIQKINIIVFLVYSCFAQGVTVSTMKGILEEMMTLFPDQYFHLGLDEVITTSVCTMESKLNVSIE